MQSSFKAQTIFRLISLEVSTIAKVMLLLGVAQADPPFFAGCVDRLCARACQFGTRVLPGLLVGGECDNHCTPTAQRGLIYIQLVARRSLLHSSLQPPGCH